MSSVSLAAAEAPLVLALDLGTSSFRALCYDGKARVVEGCEEQIAHTPRVTADGGVVADAAELFDLLVLCIDGALHRLGRRASDLVAVGSSCFWHSLVGTGPEGEPTTPLLLWADTRSGPFVKELKHELDPLEVQQRTGCILHSSYWPAKLRWLQATSPDAYQRTTMFLSFAEYAARRLQNDSRVSLSMASGTGLLAIASATWDSAMLDHLNLSRERLPELMDIDQPQHPLSPRYAERWPALADVPWFPAAGDGACANTGSGAVHPDTFALTLGTSGALRLVRDDANAESPAGIWTYRLDARHAVVGGSLSNGGNLLAWLGDLFDIDFDGDAIDDAARLKADGHSLTVLPFIAEERAPGWNDEVTGVIAGLKLGTQPEQVIRAAMESVAYRFARVYDQLCPLAKTDHRIVANGGAILRSPAWIQIVADTLGHELRTLPAEAEVSGRGAAIIALVGSGHLTGYDAAPDPSEQQPVYQPNPANHDRYRAAIARQQLLESHLFPDGGTWDQ
ncbi:MAG: gluconokinase [Thermomicrobiales bacterium]